MMYPTTAAAHAMHCGLFPEFYAPYSRWHALIDCSQALLVCRIAVCPDIGIEGLRLLLDRRNEVAVVLTIGVHDSIDLGCHFPAYELGVYVCLNALNQVWCVGFERPSIQAKFWTLYPHPHFTMRRYLVQWQYANADSTLVHGNFSALGARCCATWDHGHSDVFHIFMHFLLQFICLTWIILKGMCTSWRKTKHIHLYKYHWNVWIIRLMCIHDTSFLICSVFSASTDNGFFLSRTSSSTGAHSSDMLCSLSSCWLSGCLNRFWNVLKSLFQFSSSIRKYVEQNATCRRKGNAWSTVSGWYLWGMNCDNSLMFSSFHAHSAVILSSRQRKKDCYQPKHFETYGIRWVHPSSIGSTRVYLHRLKKVRTWAHPGTVSELAAWVKLVCWWLLRFVSFDGYKSSCIVHISEPAKYESKEWCPASTETFGVSGGKSWSVFNTRMCKCTDVCASSCDGRESRLKATMPASRKHSFRTLGTRCRTNRERKCA